MKNRNNRAITVLLFLGVSCLASCDGRSSYTASRLQLGTIINLTAVASSEKEALQASERVFEEIGRVENLMSPYKPGSDVYRINQAGWEQPVAVSEDTFLLLKRSAEISVQTGGAFDITFASLSSLWNFNLKKFIPPSRESVARRLPLVNYRLIVLDPAGRRVRLSRRGTRIGLGGIAKGYAIKRGIEAFRSAGITAAIVEAGGDLQVLGNKRCEPWRVGLAHPRKKGIVLSIALEDGEAVTTSGDYERFAVYEGVRYHHILDPRTGFPAKGLLSVSVIAKDAVDADAFATALFVMGREKALKFLSGRRDIQAILVDLDMNYYASKELKGRIVLLEDVKIRWF